MAKIENKVFNTAVQSLGEDLRLCPEAVICAFAKFISLSDGALNALLGEEGIKQVEGIRKFFEEKEFDLDLLKAGLGMIANKKSIIEQGNKDSFAEFLENADDSMNAMEIIAKACELSTVPLKELFSKGKNMEDIFSYLNELKSKEEIAKTASEDAKTMPKEAEELEDEEEPDSIIVFTKDNSEDDEGDESEEVIIQEKKKKTGKTKPSKQLDMLELTDMVRSLHAVLLDKVKGQESAILKFVQGIYQAELIKNSEKGNHPRASFFFFGPSGVGKSYLAQVAAEQLGRKYLHVSMDSVLDLKMLMNGLGAFVKNNPESVIILDGIEKVNPAITMALVQLLDSGTLDGMPMGEKKAEFADAIVIMISSKIGETLFEEDSVETFSEKAIMNALGDTLPQDMCSRIASGNMVMFNRLSTNQIETIIREKMESVVDGIRESFGCNVTFSKYLPRLFYYSRGSSMDGRIASAQSGEFVKEEIYELMRHISDKPTDISFDLDWDNMDDEFKPLFRRTKTCEALIFADSSAKEALNELNLDNIKLKVTDDISKAIKALESGQISFTLIDPFSGKKAASVEALSAADLDTDGVKLFYEATRSGCPVYILDRGGKLSKTDERTFMQDGARGICKASKRVLEDIAFEVYMEKQSDEFSGLGWVLDFHSRQMLDTDGKAKVVFYDFRKTRVLDGDGRRSVLADAEKPNVKFDEVIGAESAIKELKFFSEYLSDPQTFLLKGYAPPKGILLYGPPGTGKTMLARAMASESNATFLQATGASFKNKYVGESEANIRKLFAKARKYAPSIIFIDEIDSIARDRENSGEHSQDMLETLLTEMEGFDMNRGRTKPVFVLAATNYGIKAGDGGKGVLDEAVVRRFDRRVKVDLPGKEGRITFLKRMAAKKKIDLSEEFIKSFADRTTGISLSIIQNIINTAERSIVGQKRKINGDDLLTALEEHLHGEKREHSLEEYEKTAIHESGHAVMYHLCGWTPPYITIESRGDFGGYMRRDSSEFEGVRSKEDMIKSIRTSLAGRASEEVFFGREAALNSGASGDLDAANREAFNIVCRLAMEEGEMLVFSREEIMNSALAEKYLGRMNAILNEEYNKTLNILSKNKDMVRTVADALIEQSRLTSEEFLELVGK